MHKIIIFTNFHQQKLQTLQKKILYFKKNISNFGDHCFMIDNAGRSWKAKIWSCYHDYSQCWVLLQVHGGLHQPPGDAWGQEQVNHCPGHLCQCTHSTPRHNCNAQTYKQKNKHPNRDYFFTNWLLKLWYILRRLTYISICYIRKRDRYIFQ